MITVVGLGPGDLERVGSASLALLTDPANRVIVRTLRHPAAATLAQQRPVESCDDLYEEAECSDDLYAAVAERLLEAGERGNVIYAVPGSPLVGEFAVATVRRLANERGIGLEVVPAESFIDAVLATVGYDPLDRGLIVLNGQSLPDPLVLDHPTIIGHLPDRMLLSEVISRIDRVLPEDTEATVLIDLGTPAAQAVTTTVATIDPGYAGLRTSLFLDPAPSGLVGAVTVMRRLRRECPWDRRQTHRSLLTHLLEESSELVDAVSALPVEAPGGESDWVAYSAVEDELGDVLLQVLFHTVMAEEAGAFTIDDVAEGLRRKLVRRHPHVFGDVEASTPSEVLRNWEAIKSDEKTGTHSLMDGVPVSMGGLTRAAKLQKRAASAGFDWEGPDGVIPKLTEELAEFSEVIDQPEEAEREIGDLLFTLVNLARHLGLDSELALRGAVSRFESRVSAGWRSSGGTCRAARSNNSTSCGSRPKSRNSGNADELDPAAPLCDPGRRVTELCPWLGQGGGPHHLGEPCLHELFAVQGGEHPPTLDQLYRLGWRRSECGRLCGVADPLQQQVHLGLVDRRCGEDDQGRSIGQRRCRERRRTGHDEYARDHPRDCAARFLCLPTRPTPWVTPAPLSSPPEVAIGWRRPKTRSTSSWQGVPFSSGRLRPLLISPIT